MWVDPATWFQWTKVSAFAIGLIVGAFAVAGPVWVWSRKQVLTLAAGWIATLGTAMIGMSIWQSIEIEGAGFSARLGQIQERVEVLNRNVKVLDNSVNTLRKATISSAIDAVDDVSALTLVETPPTAISPQIVGDLDPYDHRSTDATLAREILKVAVLGMDVDKLAAWEEKLLSKELCQQIEAGIADEDMQGYLDHLRNRQGALNVRLVERNEKKFVCYNFLDPSKAARG
jgi:hypothetical protein